MISPGARMHLGFMLALFAFTIGTSQILAPYELAAGLPFPVAAGVVQLHRSVAFVMVGVCVAVAALSVIWSFRPMHSLAAGAWLALSAAVVGAYYLLPDSAADETMPMCARRAPGSKRWRTGSGVPRSGQRRETAGSLALGRRRRRWRGCARIGERFPRRPRGMLPPAQGGRPVWVALGGPGDSVGAFALADDTTSTRWRAAHLACRRRGAGGRVAARVPPRPAVGAASRAGDRVRHRRPASPFPECCIGSRWPGRCSLHRCSGRPSAWHGDSIPRSGLTALAPFATWENAARGSTAVDCTGCSKGYATSEVMPAARRRAWYGRQVSYLRAGFVGVVNSETGATDLYLRPDPDPLGTRVGGAIGAAHPRPQQISPQGVLAALEYPAALLSAQADLIAESRSHLIATDTATIAVPGVDRRPLPGGSRGRLVVPVVDRRTGRLDLAGRGHVWDGHADRLLETVPDSTMAPEGPEVLTRRWGRFPYLQQMRDSVDGHRQLIRDRPGAVRLEPRGTHRVPAFLGGGFAGQGDAGAGDGGAVETGIGAGRSLEEAWKNSRGEMADYLRMSDEAAIVGEARRWLREADSAFKRGDLAAFGRAFAALKSVLEGERQNPPK